MISSLQESSEDGNGGSHTGREAASSGGVLKLGNLSLKYLNGGVAGTGITESLGQVSINGGLNESGRLHNGGDNSTGCWVGADTIVYQAAA